jgi:hypothetical protein
MEYAGAVLIALYAPGNAVHGGPTYTNSHRNKNVNVDKIKHIFIILVLPTKSLFNRVFNKIVLNRLN